VFQTLVARLERALEQRRESPAEVSRTRVAREATREQRAQREREEHALVRSVAREAGMPLEEEG
jgi:hypothetical protein